MGGGGRAVAEVVVAEDDEVEVPVVVPVVVDVEAEAEVVDKGVKPRFVLPLQSSAEGDLGAALPRLKR